MLMFYKFYVLYKLFCFSLPLMNLHKQFNYNYINAAAPIKKTISYKTKASHK